MKIVSVIAAGTLLLATPRWRNRLRRPMPPAYSPPTLRR